MSGLPTDTNTDELIERIVREVIRRLLAMGLPPATPGSTLGSTLGATPTAAPVRFSITDKLVTTKTLEAIPAGVVELIIPAKSIVTPLARDEAKAKGMRLTRSGDGVPR
jgi:hypothetical protein